jgi:putative transposase
MAIYGELKKDIGWILRKLCDEKGVEIIEAECCPDHIHMLLSIPPKYSISTFMGFLKGKSSLMIFDRQNTSTAQEHSGQEDTMWIQ